LIARQKKSEIIETGAATLIEKLSSRLWREQIFRNRWQALYKFKYRWV